MSDVVHDTECFTETLNCYTTLAELMFVLLSVKSCQDVSVYDQHHPSICQSISGIVFGQATIPVFM